MTLQKFLLGDVAAAVRTRPDLLIEWGKLGYVPRADAETFTRNEVAYAAVIAVLVRFGMTPKVAWQTMQSAVEDQQSYWTNAIDNALCGSEVNLFQKRYDYNGQEYVEAQLFVPAPRTDERDPDRWLPLLTGLEAQRQAFADAERSGQMLPDETLTTALAAGKAIVDPVITFEIGSAIATALKSLPR